MTLAAVFARGFFSDGGVQVALAVSAAVAVVSGVVGVFTVIRGQSFAGHAIADLGATGGAAAFLVGVGPLWGFVAIGVVAAGMMELIGIQRPRGRDLATGIVLGAGLGLAALFLYWDTIYQSTSGATVTILFGSVFAIGASTIPIVIVLGVFAIGLIAAIYRPLLLSSVSPEIGAARGLPVRAVGAAFLLAMAISVSLAAVTIGAILSTALLIGPAAAALRVTKRPGAAIATAVVIGLAATWLGIVLAYDSYDWPPVGHGWPVSFFVVVAVFVFYLLAGLLDRLRRSSRVGRRS
jgi:zinc/manganese transport system permease protein